MKKDFRLTAFIVLAASQLGLAQSAPPAGDSARSAAVALAVRFESLAMNSGAGSGASPPLLHELSALAEAAGRLDPTEARYPRLQAEFLLQAKDDPAAIEPLLRYVKLAPSDQFAQAELIDLYVEQMQTADAILAYLHNVVIKASLPAPVRSHAAVVAAQTYLSHSQPDEAEKMLDSALSITPVDTLALQLKYNLSQKEGPARRVSLLLGMLRANPVDALATTHLAGELADLGLLADSMDWYFQAFSDGANSPEFVRGAASEFFLGGQSVSAANLLSGYLQQVPEDLSAWMIRLAIAKDAGKPEETQSLAGQALLSASKRLNLIRAQFQAPDTGAATQPGEAGVAALPDLTQDPALLIKLNRPELADAYASTLGDIAWIHLFFLRDAGEKTQTILKALKGVLPDDDVTLARLEGWNYLVQTQGAQAQQKLQAVADRDPLAALGLIVIDPVAHASQAEGLLAQHPSGVMAAVLFSELRAHQAKVVPTAQSQPIKAQVDQFPREWLDFAVHPHSFYMVTAAAVSSTVNIGQPILARVTIENISSFDLTVGPQGALKPYVLFGVNNQSMLGNQIPTLLFATYWQRLVLPAQQKMTQVIRIDRGQLAALLSSRPDVVQAMNFNVTTNPIQNAKGQSGGGPGGISVPLDSLVERPKVPFQTDRDKQAIFAALTKGTPTARLDALECLASLELLARAGKTQSATAPGDGEGIISNVPSETDLLPNIRRLTGDPDSSVRTWAELLDGQFATDTERAAVVQNQVKSATWTERLVGLMTAQMLPDHGSGAATYLAADQDKTVKAMATALGQVLPARADSQPASGPSQP